MSSDGNARWCAVDPRRGTALTVAESCLNVACAGARPVALVNCLNFGNPEHPEVMWQLSESVDGMAEVCTALGLPVIGGNVSLYNESRGADIDPTPVVVVLGLIDSLTTRPPGIHLVEGGSLVLLGRTEPTLGGSRWALACREHRGGRLPALDLAVHQRLLTLVAALVNDRAVAGIHDVADGGLAVALAELAVQSQLGFRVHGIADHRALFGESPSRVVLCVEPGAEGAVLARAGAAGVLATTIGTVGGDRLIVDGVLDLGLAEATRAWQGAIPDALV
jgi:phosphoribosylformylglycinamidine synthase